MFLFGGVLFAMMFVPPLSPIPVVGQTTPFQFTIVGTFLFFVGLVFAFLYLIRLEPARSAYQTFVLFACYGSILTLILATALHTYPGILVPYLMFLFVLWVGGALYIGVETRIGLITNRNGGHPI